MKKKILIVGKNSFIGLNIYKILKKKLDITSLDFEEAKNRNSDFFNKFYFVINCSIHKKYINKKYNVKYDFDLLLASKIKFLDCKYIFFSSRKVYSSKFNSTEKSKINPTTQYGKNKKITEIKLQKILNKKLLILRVSNIIGFRNKNKRMVHFTFLDHFLKNINQNKVIFTKNIYKDFLSISQFVNIIYMLIKKNAYGVINVSLGKKIYVRDLVNWLNFYNPNKLEYIYTNKGINFDCFTLNNDKLKKLINYKVLKSDLRKDCIMISKKIFQKK